jgi:glycosyltransferase involved in cell wall biosynthesis
LIDCYKSGKSSCEAPDWILEIYGNASGNLDLKSLAEKLNVSNVVVFHEPVQDIEHKYVEASFYLMTSRSKVLEWC